MRERLLLPSASGRYYVVVEVDWEYIEPDLEESDICELTPDELAEVGWKGTCYELSGWLCGKSQAGIRRAWLAREGRWLAEATKAKMRAGEVVRVRELEWEEA